MSEEIEKRIDDKYLVDAKIFILCTEFIKSGQVPIEIGFLYNYLFSKLYPEVVIELNEYNKMLENKKDKVIEPSNLNNDDEIEEEQEEKEEEIKEFKPKPKDVRISNLWTVQQ